MYGLPQIPLPFGRGVMAFHRWKSYWSVTEPITKNEVFYGVLRANIIERDKMMAPRIAETDRGKAIKVLPMWRDS